MIKRIFIMLMLALTVSLALTACNDNSNEEAGGGHTHSYVNKYTYVDGAQIKEPTCTEGGEYYYVCTCGQIGTETYTTAEMGHSFSERIEDEAHLKAEKDCQKGNIYYYDCIRCSVISSDETFESGRPGDHIYENNECIYSCGEQLNKYTLSPGGEYYILSSFRESCEIAVVPEAYKGIPVKEIGAMAFVGSDARKVVLPDSVEKIGKNAFYQNDIIEEINLENVKYIEENAFSFCERLGNVDISSAIMIGDYAFARTNISEITIPEGVLSVGTCALFYCKELTKINYLAVNAADLDMPNSILGLNNDEVPLVSLYIGENVKRIPDNLFSYSKLSEIRLDENGINVEIGERAFYNSLGNKTLELSTVSKIGALAFSNSDITALTLGGAINEVGDSAFGDCDNLTEVTITANGGGFGSHVFSNCESLATVYYRHEGSEKIGRAFMGANVNLVIGKEVKTIPDNFEEAGVNTITFEDGASGISIGRYAFISSISGTLDLSCVVSIGAYAFYRSGIDSTLEKVIIGSDVKSIGSYAFGRVQAVEFLAEDCDDVVVAAGDSEVGSFISIDQFRVGSGVQKIPGGMLAYADIGSVSFDRDSVCGIIGQRAFFYANIRDFELHSAVREIKNSAFEGASAENPILLVNIDTLGERAFCYYSGVIEAATIVLSEIPDRAFMGSGVRGELTLNSIKMLGKNAFYACTGISKITFLNNLENVYEQVFAGCTGIERVEFNVIGEYNLVAPIFTNSNSDVGFELIIGKNVTRIPDYMFSNSSVNEIIFDEESICEQIGVAAFSNTYNLQYKALVIPDSVKRIEENAFVLTKLASVTIGSGISYIGKGAFHSMGISGVEDYGFIEKIYFTSEVSFVAIEYETGNTSEVTFLANSEENAEEYAKLLYRPSYTYTKT